MKTGEKKRTTGILRQHFTCRNGKRGCAWEWKVTGYHTHHLTSEVVIVQRKRGGVLGGLGVNILLLLRGAKSFQNYYSLFYIDLTALDGALGKCKLESTWP